MLMYDIPNIKQFCVCADWLVSRFSRVKMARNPTDTSIRQRPLVRSDLIDNKFLGKCAMFTILVYSTVYSIIFI